MFCDNFLCGRFVVVVQLRVLSFDEVLDFNRQRLLSSRVARWFTFRTKNSNLGVFRRAFDRNMLAYFMTIWSTLQSFLTLYCHFV
jgi:hypothetical protein